VFVFISIEIIPLATTYLKKQPCQKQEAAATPKGTQVLLINIKKNVYMRLKAKYTSMYTNIQNIGLGQDHKILCKMRDDIYF
jgi:hypothetical protein